MATELKNTINMDELKEFNPKLYEQIQNKPEVLLELKDLIWQMRL